MNMTVKALILDQLLSLEREMASQSHTEAAEALRETVDVLATAARGWLTTRQAADQLDVSIPTVMDWIGRDALDGQRVGTVWLVSEEGVQKVLGLRQVLADMELAGYPTEGIQALTMGVRREAGAEERRKVVG